MNPKITTWSSRTFIGKCIETTLSANQTAKLWQSFMPRLSEIENRVNGNLFSIQEYPKDASINEFDHNTIFYKWAAVEVSERKSIPKGMDVIEIPEGKYAVFIHHGLAKDFPKTFQYIFEEWLPNSGYQLDQRPQFEIMKSNYRPNDVHAEEEVWIPIV